MKVFVMIKYCAAIPFMIYGLKKNISSADTRSSALDMYMLMREIPF
ncbi:hypothetical protein SAMN05660226_03400 [Parapedobacter luteus]|uniref:Uncharacterized protein n=1 Tax=Parapedobacter luteus TaxID=623280 RepID=A0A1T5EL13_9SPHI|nr:hypothetical protein SAMN05660226_03400 [Parapedobacter luteus]